MPIFSSMFRARHRVKNLGRYRQIIQTILKYGLDDMMEFLKIEPVLKTGRRILRIEESIKKFSRAKRVALALEELGPTFIKFGQILSTRADIIPPEYLVELEKLQDQLRPLSFEPFKNQLEESLKLPLESYFSFLDEQPLASASIAQVYRATLLNGEQVILKIKRPGIEKTIEADLEILQTFALLIERHMESFKNYSPVKLVKEFEKTIRHEISFTREAQNVRLCQEFFKNDPSIYIPKLYNELCSDNLIVMEFVKGIKITDLDKLKKEGLDPKQIAKNGADAFLKQVFIHGFFQGDPHPGNMVVQERNVICILDYGMFGRLNDRNRKFIAGLLIGVIQRNPDLLVDSFLSMGVIDNEIDPQELRADLAELIDHYYMVPLCRLDLVNMIKESVHILYQYRLKILPDLMLLLKALLTIEGIGRTLDPDFNLVVHAEPFVEKLIQSKINPMMSVSSMIKVSNSINDLIKVLPGDIKDILFRLKKGRLKVEIDLSSFEKMILDLDKASNRLSFSILIAALVIGSSLMIQGNLGMKFLGLSILGIMGYLIAGLLGILLLISILRSGRL